ncbi:hypothetical protein AKN87_03065 [Thiopseudomonas alkaliphila]|uniref:hypothetical protein n=1 Tax=Thiopseudomonas alkaliphila TaxID=1697053 RepID=UPI00069D6238|nr:hypothetical protein [Thiopseudomonas alkaliphila]AKX44191.1 hypothetical protein AKN87_03065 [Thiopseudomonas alkaliphila]
MKDYANAPDKKLRKAWLKRKFLSFEYHEELVTLHSQWLKRLYELLKASNAKEEFPEDYDYLWTIAIPNFEKISKPGQLDPNKWEPGRSAGVARSIPDYRELMYHNYCWNWLDKHEWEQEILQPWNEMLRMCTNIRQTVDNLWFNPRKGNDDAILNERYTGPIDWPAHWEDAPREVPKSVAGGQSCPRSGWWFSLAEPQTIQRYYFKEGETFPVFEGSRYGDTFWQWAHNQSDTQE